MLPEVARLHPCVCERVCRCVRSFLFLKALGGKDEKTYCTIDGGDLSSREQHTRPPHRGVWSHRMGLLLCHFVVSVCRPWGPRSPCCQAGHVGHTALGLPLSLRDCQSLFPRSSCLALVLFRALSSLTLSPPCAFASCLPLLPSAMLPSPVP